MTKPYVEVHLRDNLYVRHFKPGDHMQWHADEEDRNVYSLIPNDWKLQIDNQLPTPITTNAKFIAKGIQHRLIPGETELFLYVVKSNKKPSV